MARSSRRQQNLKLFVLLVALGNAQTLSDAPTLSTTTNTATATTGGSDTTTSGTFVLNGAPTLSTTSVSHLTGLPTIAVASIPTLVIPYTANAPFMQKSTLPEGTFFIAVGATLAFLGACVLLWRAIVAWSINLSAKRSAKAPLGAPTEKSGGGGGRSSRKSSGYNPAFKASLYDDADGNSVSMENLTGGGSARPARYSRPHHPYRDSVAERGASAPPEDLFFSPTAAARDAAGARAQRRGSGYMPSGFYASPSSQPAGGAANTTIGGGGGAGGPYAQYNVRPSVQSAYMSRASPSVSPERSSRGTTLRGESRDGPTHSREGSRYGGNAREGLGGARHSPRNSQLYVNPSSSSLMVGQSSLGSNSESPTRASSAYGDDLFNHHGYGRRERY